MPNETVRRLVREAIALDFAERGRSLEQQRREALFDAARRGASQSSRNALRVAELYRAEVKIRGALLAQVYARIAAAFPISAGDGPLAEANAFLLPLLNETVVSLGNALQEMLSKTPFGVGINLTDAHQAAQRRLLLDAELMEAQMVAKKSEGAGPRITVKGNQNIIQSGSPGASAGIHLDAGSKAQIADALKQVRDALNALTPEGMPTRAETLATISEAEAELAKEAPNKIKLPALLQGVGGAIQTVAAVEPAYLTLKGALALIGLYV